MSIPEGCTRRRDPSAALTATGAMVLGAPGPIRPGRRGRRFSFLLERSGPVSPARGPETPPGPESGGAKSRVTPQTQIDILPSGILRRPSAMKTWHLLALLALSIPLVLGACESPCGFTEPAIPSTTSAAGGS